MMQNMQNNSLLELRAELLRLQELEKQPPKIVREVYGWMTAHGFGLMPDSQFGGLMKRLRAAAGVK